MTSRSPPRSSADIYANRTSRIPYPPFLTPSELRTAPAMASPVSVSSQRNSTLVHRGFYDLLSLVPGTPGVGVGNRNGASRLWNDPGGGRGYDDFVAGTRYEDMPGTPASPTKPRSPPPPPPAPTRSYGLEWAYNYYAGPPPPTSPTKKIEEPQSPRGKRRISKDMVGRPMGFIHLVHASDADQAEAILQRWGPDGLGKLGNPNWAQPIKNQIRARQQERAVAEVMHAMDPTPSTSSAGQPILRVMNGVSTSTLTTTSATTTIPTPGVEKSYSRLGLGATPRALATQLEVEEQGGGGGSTEGRTGHGSRESSEVTVKGRSVVPTPAKGAAPAVSTSMGTGIGYGAAGPSRSPTQRSPVQSYNAQNQQGTYVPQQPVAYSPPRNGYPYTPAQPIPYQSQQSGAYPQHPVSRSPPQQQPVPRSPQQQQPLSRSPPKSRSSPKSQSPRNQSPRNQSPVPPKTPIKDRSPARPLPIPSPTNRAGVGATDDPLAMHAAELMKGVNPSPGYLGTPPIGGHPGTPGTIRIHDEGLPMPPGAVWGGGIGEEVEQAGEMVTPAGAGSGGIGVPRGFTNAIIGGRSDKWEADGGVRPPPPKPFRPSLTTLDKAVSAKIYFENVYFPLLRLPPSREQRRVAMEAEMEQLNIPQNMRTQLRAKWRANETAYLRERRRRVDQRAFVKLKTIGHGAFGVVSLVKEKETGELYAMKQMRKVDMLRKGQEGHVRAERDVLKGAALAASPTGADWIVRLFYSFQDQDHLYLVLEFMGGGDLLNLLIERDIFEENFARFYIAEMVLAIEQCHKQGFIHRDIKPDNFLFDPNGHLKLSDFGLATDLHWAHDTSYYEQQRRDLLHKHGIDLDDGESHKTRRMDRREAERVMGGGEGIFTWREKNRKKLAYSVCGTNSYMSPEVIRGQGYSFSCDWWSLGVIMFECLYGYPPFVSNSRHVTRQKILNWRTSLRFPPRPRVSREGVDLIERLLCEPEDRIGAQGALPPGMNRRSGFFGGSIDGADHIKAHPWFKTIDFARIHDMEAPFRPELRRPDDTKHFDTDIAPEPLAPANGAPPDATRDPLLRDKVHGPRILESRKALAFAGFTHKSPRKISYGRVDDVLRLSSDDGQQQLGHVGNDEQRGRTMIKEQGTIGRSRAISM